MRYSREPFYFLICHIGDLEWNGASGSSGSIGTMTLWAALTANANQYKLAQKRVEDLLPLVDDSTPLDDPKAVELMMMSDIVIDYESEHFPIAKPSVAELIADGLKENHITQKQLAEELGISTTRVNDFVSGKSEPNLKTAGHICRFLKIRPAAMLML